MKILIKVIVLLGLSSSIAFSEYDADGKFILGHTCEYFGLDQNLPKSVHTFRSSQQADNVITRITDAVSLKPNFEVLAGGVPNAAAVVRGDKRYILYSRSFMNDMKRETGTDWAAISVMAHEIGHHLQGHTLEAGGSRPTIELEADEFSGGVLQKMGATLEEAQIVMAKLGSEHGSSTHPAKRARLEAIAAGWETSCENSNCAEMASSGSSSKSKRKPRKEKPGPNSCSYAYDGSCDEPEFCDRGTDTDDCSAAPPRSDVRQRNQYPQQTPQVRPARFCCHPNTGAPVCPMSVPMLPGQYCVCPGVQGAGLTCG